MIINGKHPIAGGDKTTCGATFIPNQNLLVRERTTGASSSSQNSAKVYDEQIIAVDEDGQILSNISYYIEAPNGEVYKGKTDSSGKCPRIKTSNVDQLKIWLGDDADLRINANGD